MIAVNESIMKRETQGRDPVLYFGMHGITPDQVLDDARMIAASRLTHDFDLDGPHVVTGPVAIKGAQPGDVLKVEVLSLIPRVPYGVISSRHGKGALPGEFPENDGPQGAGSAEHPEVYNNASVFAAIEVTRGNRYAILHNRIGEEVRFPIDPFMGIMGVAPDTSRKINSIPPAEYGGNLDINELGVGSTLYLPVQVPEALFYTGDPHYAQGDGEVALTALEAPLRATFRLTLLAAGDAGIPGGSPFTHAFAESGDYWIPIGLDPDLDEAMKQAVREGIKFLSVSLGIDRAVAYAYLSAATDFEISQVVDRTKGHRALGARDDGAAVADPHAAGHQRLEREPAVELAIACQNLDRPQHRVRTTREQVDLVGSFRLDAIDANYLNQRGVGEAADHQLHVHVA